ncbi:hypothetical protein [Brachybacterium sp. Z12]|uniref:hypothetical protein n=1 Tax=Brachybacterium sp. Z12 TaxID=2759167 RepID=UPI00223B9E18|nr:hypothetical protein [Brachybacterium sp. Z12]
MPVRSARACALSPLEGRRCGSSGTDPRLRPEGRPCSFTARTAARPRPRALRRTAGLRAAERRAEVNRETRDIGSRFLGDLRHERAGTM